MRGKVVVKEKAVRGGIATGNKRVQVSSSVLGIVGLGIGYLNGVLIGVV